MRQYLAIIIDSFRAAMASRVLYVLLLLITLLLLVIAPFRYVETLDWKLVNQQHIKDPASVVERLVQRKDDPKYTEMARIWDQLPNRLKKDLQSDSSETSEQTADSPDEPAQPSNARARRQKNAQAVFDHQNLIDELNTMIADPDFYREQDWKRFRLSGELKSLKEQLDKNYSAKHSRRFNRLLIGRAFRSSISKGETTSMAAWYGPWPVELFDVPITQSELGSEIISFISFVLDKFVLSIGLAIALLVTASIIPETFDPGVLNLLLSKPISRSRLFLAKFIGGCVFIALCATYLFVGIWLWLGLGLGVWDNAILYCIVLYITVFAVYYSVSSFVGLVTRSAILSVIVTILFWGSCFIIGSTHGLFNTRIENNRVVAIQQSGEKTIQLNGSGQLYDWDDQDKTWTALMPDLDDQERIQLETTSWIERPRELPLPYSPVINPTDSKVIAGYSSFTDPTSLSRQKMFVAEQPGEPFRLQGRFPSEMMDLLQGKNLVLAVTASGKIYRFQDPNQTDEESSDKKNKRGRTTKRYYVEMSPKSRIPIRNRGNAALNRQSDDLAIYHDGTMHVFKIEDDQYTSTITRPIETGAGPTMSCLLHFQQNHIVMAMGNGDIILLDATTLDEIGRYRCESHYPVDSMTASQDGSAFFLRTSNQRLWMLDTEELATRKAPVKGQGSISAATVNDANELLVADRTSRITQYDISSFSKSKTLAPADSVTEKIFRMGIHPLYRLWPKPGEFYKVITHLSSSNNTENNSSLDLRTQPKHQNPFAPVIGGVIFMACMLAINCLYFSRKDY